MNIWETGPFQDDLAIDWLEDLHDSDAMAFFGHCLDLSDTDDLHHLACIGVVCTAAMLVGLLSDSFELPLPESARSWLKEHRVLATDVPILIPDAIAGIQAVMSEDSEMSVRWQDRGETLYECWKVEMQQIAAQLQAIATRVQ